MASIPCIYCNGDDPEKFSGREHVIPQAFGTFGSQTPVLKCVCDDCNRHFGKELDLIHARDTLEGLLRYKHGIFSSENRQQRRLRFTLADEDESGELVGAAVGGIAGGLIGLGIPEIEAKRYEGKIKQGNLLLSVHTEDSEEATLAKEIFTKAGAQDICATGEASTPTAPTPAGHKASERVAQPTMAAYTGAGR